MTASDVDLIEEEDTFSWDDYLKSTKSEAALVTCFCQQLVPPKNEFVVGNKLETFDPRNTTSTCIGTVIEVSGSRLRLRLDGTDDRNDFWLMVDSDLMHAYGYTARQNRKIQPPLGYGNDISKWPRFLEKIISTAAQGNNVFAAESCFKPVPTRPLKNEFKVGHKLEAVDPKNPHLICPATIKEIKRDKLLITFDGWSHSSDFWCSFASRDLFPVGFCAKSGHILQFPGNLYDKKIAAAAAAAANQSLNSSVVDERDSSSISPSGLTKRSRKKSSPDENTKIKNETISANSSCLNITEKDLTAVAGNDSISTPAAATTLAAKNTSSPKVTLTNLDENQNNAALLDLSLVKVEAIEPDDTSQNSHLKTVNLNSNIDLNTKTCVTKPKQTLNAVVFLVPNGDCGKYIKTDKFHSAHTRFGPGGPANVYKSILQSLIDCAINRFEVFKLVPTGKSNEYVRLKNNNYNERKTINPIEGINDLWSNLKTICKILEIDDTQLFSKTKISNNSLTKKQIDRRASNAATKTTDLNEQQPQTASSLPLTPQPTSSSSASSSSSSSSSTSSETPPQTVATNSIEEFKPICNKRRSTTASATNGISTNDEEQTNNNDASTQCKVMKLDKSLSSVQVSDWTVDQVVFYIYQLNDSNFSSYIDMFRHHEIDGRALLLLTTDILMKYMGFKLGPALKMNNYIEKLRKNLLTSILNYNQVTPKVECNY